MPKPHNFPGFSLLEVLIATFILAFGLLGVMGLYIQSFKTMKNSYWQTLATSQFMAINEKPDIVDWSKECKSLLPHGECSNKNGKVSVCWGMTQNRQCLK